MPLVLLSAVWAAHWGADKLADPLQKLRQQWGISSDFSQVSSFFALTSGISTLVVEGLSCSSFMSGRKPLTLQDNWFANLMGFD